MSDVHELRAIKALLYRAALNDPEELAFAAHTRLGALPTAEQYAEFIDFFVIEWVDANGCTLAERVAASGDVPAEVAMWSAEVQTALWVVDGWEADVVMLRDIATESEIAVVAPNLSDELPPRTVLRARVVPWAGASRWSGEPDVYGPMGVIARMELLETWRESGEPELEARLRALRAAFRAQREERAAWIAHFGADVMVWPDAAQMGAAMAGFTNFLFNTFRNEQGLTRADRYRAVKGDDPLMIQFALGDTLTGPGRHGAIYDAAEGIHFLPRLGEFFAHLRGTGSAPDVVGQYLTDPGISRLPFERAGETTALAAYLGVSDAPMATLLTGHKPPRGRARPSVLPGFDD